MSGVAGQIYNTFFRSNAVMLSSVFVTAFGIQLAFDSASDKVWNGINRGRQWQDIKGKIMEQSGEGEDDDE